MLGELNHIEIESLLRNQRVGRIGCCDGDDVFVVPITYAYDCPFIYGHSKLGRKIKMMRNNPSVCFEVDQVTNMKDWKSVIAWASAEQTTQR